MYSYIVMGSPPCSIALNIWYSMPWYHCTTTNHKHSHTHSCPHKQQCNKNLCPLAEQRVCSLAKHSCHHCGGSLPTKFDHDETCAHPNCQWLLPAWDIQLHSLLCSKRGTGGYRLHQWWSWEDGQHKTHPGTSIAIVLKHVVQGRISSLSRCKQTWCSKKL